MRIAIVSDLHGNLEALRSLPEDYDELWVLGDLVTYGPNPNEVVEAVRARASVVVRGNHDHAAGTGEDPRCSAAFRAMAAATLDFARDRLGAEEKAYLAGLPLTAERVVDGKRFFLCHAVPSDPLFTYCRADSDRWRREVERAGADVLLGGHTHVPFAARLGARTVANPGSLGQPKHGAPRACYAVWENDRMELRSAGYAVEDTVSKIMALPVEAEVKRSLAEVLRTGTFRG